ncbi:MAG: hypothetical protein ACHQ50_07150 [Fimbriimonadales bacterium]
MNRDTWNVEAVGQATRGTTPQRLVLVLAALAMATISSGQTRLAVSFSGHPAGYATLSQKIQKDGTKVVELRMELDSHDGKVRLTSESRYDAKGLPLRKFQQIVNPAIALNKQIVTTFDKAGANTVVLDGEKRKARSVPLVETAPRASLSEFWFIRDTPKKGQVEQTYQFNIDTLEWELVRTEYRGNRTLKIESHTVSVHEVYSERGDKKTTAYLDEQGLPILVDDGNIRMVKIWPK